MEYLSKYKEWIKHKTQWIRIRFCNYINRCDCPYDPDDNPCPQSCDRRIINTDYCKNSCPWRNPNYDTKNEVHVVDNMDASLRLTYPHRVENPNSLNLYQVGVLNSVNLDPRMFKFNNYIEIWDGVRTYAGNPVLEVVGVEYENIDTGNTLIVRVNKGGQNKIEN